MAIYRNIQISFYQDDFILSLTPEEKFFYLYLMTNSKTTQCGIYELPMRIIEFETGFDLNKVKILLKKFIDFRKVLYSDETKEIMLLNWMKHNPPANFNVQKRIDKELKGVKNTQFIQIFKNPSGTVMEPLDNRYNTVCEPLPSNKHKKKKNKENKNEKGDCNFHPELIKMITLIRPEDDAVDLANEYFLGLIPQSLYNKEFVAMWLNWVEYRATIRKKLIETSAKEQITFLTSQADPIAVIKLSIQNQWQGLFPIGQKYGTRNNTSGATNEQLAKLATQHYFEQSGGR